MSAYFNLQDKEHPFEDISAFLKIVDSAPIKFLQFKNLPSLCRTKTPSTPMHTIAEDSAEPITEDGSDPLKTLSDSFTRFELELDKKILSGHQRYYEDYKYLVLYLSFFITHDDAVTSPGFRKIFELNKSIEAERVHPPPNISNAFENWERTLKESSPVSSVGSVNYSSKQSAMAVSTNPQVVNLNLINLIMVCYLYHLSLERVYFRWLGSIHDATAEKLFSQGLVLYGLMRLCYYESPPEVQANILKILYLDKLPLAISNRFCLNHGQSLLRPIRAQTQAWNLTRLFLGRLRRLILSINALNISLTLQNMVQVFDPFVQNTLGLINLLYFIPRLCSYIGPWLKHLYAYLFASEDDKKIDFWTRFWGQLHRRWEMILRDLLWFSNGFLGFFVFTGAIGFQGLYFGAAMQFLEVCLNAYLLREHKYRKQKTTSFFETQKSLMPQDQHHLFEIELRRRTWLETENGERRLFNSSMILLSNLLILPCFMSISVYIPLCGAILAIGMTVIQYYFTPTWTAKLEHPAAFPVVKSFDLSPQTTPKTRPIVSNLNLQGMSS